MAKEVGLDGLITRGLIKPKSELKWLIPEVIRSPSAMMIHAASGGGKSNIAFDLFRALTTGTSWLGFTPTEPMKCLFIDGEQDEHDLDALQEAYGLNDYPEHMNNIIFLPLVSKPDIDLTDDKYKKWLSDFIKSEGIKFIILDNSRSLFDIDENSSSSDGMKGVSTFLQGITNAGASCLLLHHNNKTGGYSGSTEQERVLIYRLQIEQEGDVRRFNAGKVRGQGKTYSRLRELDNASYEYCPLRKVLVLNTFDDMEGIFSRNKERLRAAILNGEITTSSDLPRFARHSLNLQGSTNSFTLAMIIGAYFPEFKGENITRIKHLKHRIEEVESDIDF